jgi:hypothetical protein
MGHSFTSEKPRAHTFLNKYLLARLLARQHTPKSNRQNAHTHTNVSRLKQHTRERERERERYIYKTMRSTCRDAKAKPSSGVFIIVQLRPYRERTATQ